jgi:hypothetical protein
MMKIERKTLIGSLLLTALLSVGAVQAEEDKGIRVRDSGSSAETTSASVTIESAKSEYKVDEPIRFRVKATKPMYVYVYSVDPDTGNALMLMPSRKLKENRIEANRSVTVPAKAIEFYSDKPGKEKVVVVASAKKLDIDPMKLKAMGDFGTADSEALESDFESKGIRVRDASPGGSSANGAVVKSFDLKIVAKDGRAASPAGGATVFIGTDRASYVAGDTVNIKYSADKSGWLHVYAVDTEGSYSLLSRDSIKPGQTVVRKAIAEEPTGRQALVAVHTKGKEDDESAVSRIADEMASKGDTKALRLAEEGSEDPAVAVRYFRIR